MNKLWWCVFIWFLSLCVCISSASGAEYKECTELDCQVLQKKVSLCNNAIATCQALVNEQDKSISMLKAQVSRDENQIVDEQNELKHSDTLWFIAGILLGGVITYTLHR